MLSFWVGMGNLYAVGYSNTGHCPSVAMVQDTADTACNVVIANVITPNQDGVFKGFAPEFNCRLKHYKFSVMNRWGEVVFESEDPEETWMGKDLNGEVQLSGTYVWFLHFQFVGSTIEKPEQRQGYVTLIR